MSERTFRKEVRYGSVRDIEEVVLPGNAAGYKGGWSCGGYDILCGETAGRLDSENDGLTWQSDVIPIKLNLKLKVMLDAENPLSLERH
jgi:hypothetical protein